MALILGNKLYVRMKTDGSETSKGFKANYTRACGARIVTDGSGDLMSPNYPHPWENGGECTWTIIGASISKFNLNLYKKSSNLSVCLY